MESNQNIQEESNGGLQIKDLLYLCLSKWYWFLISLAICLGVASFYILKTTPVYTRSAKMMIKSDSKGNSAGGMEDFSDLGLFRSNVNVQNELQTIKSLDNMTDVVRRLHLDMNYSTFGLFHDNVLYDKTLPVNIEILNITDNQTAALTIKLKNSEVELTNFVLDNKEKDYSKKVKGKVGDTLSTPIGAVSVMPSPYFKSKKSNPDINVTRTSINAASKHYLAEMSFALADKNADVITLSVNDVNVKRGDDIINMLIAVYNGNWLKDKNQITVSTSMFIDERLQVIEQELGNVDSDISSYKSANLLPDVEAVSNMYLNQSSANTTNITDLNNKIAVTRYIRNYLGNESSKSQLLPVNTGIGNTHIENQIAKYNETMLRRNGLVANSSVTNPLVVELDNNLDAMRNAILSSLDNQLITLQTQLAALQGNERMITSRLAANPTQAKYLLSVERQQKVKEALYLYLLQKREENELSQAFTAYNTRVIEHPNGSSAPTSPKKMLIYLVAFILGLCIPIAILYVKEFMNTKVRGRKDIEKLATPFIGEIPMAYDKKKLKLIAKNKEEAEKVVVKEGSRNVINEAFRVLRTNLEFMNRDKSGNVLMFTSFNAGSGKSFITANTALALAIKHKKVLMIDGDLRHASLSEYVKSPKQGISNYLGHQLDDADSILVPSEKYENLKVLPVGTIPPNPTELLEDERFGELIEKMRPQYDYILIDCPPIEIVADTQIIEKFIDRTIFVVRAGLLEKSMVPEIDNLYKQQKLKNMSVVLNGTESASGRYGSRYGYRYGYGHYGHYSYYGHYGYYGHKSYYHNDDEE